MKGKIGIRTILLSGLLIVAAIVAGTSFTWLPRVIGLSPGSSYPIVNTNSTDPRTACSSTYGGVTSTGMGVELTIQNRTTAIILADPVVSSNFSIAGIVFYLWRAANANTPACGTTYPSLPGTVIAQWLLPINIGFSLSSGPAISSTFTYRDEGLSVGTHYFYYLTFGINYASGTGAEKHTLNGSTPALSNIIAMEE